MDTTKPTFSICIPTCNRGIKALDKVKTLQPDLDADWELLILDNASTSELEGYQQIAAIAQTDTRVRYVRHAVNSGFHGNYLACFEHARADHIMFICDEDYAGTALIRNALPQLMANPKLGIYRGSIAPAPGQERRNAVTMETHFYPGGDQALLAYGLSNNYGSGTIYNRALATQLGLVERLRAGLVKNNLYPHLYMELLIAALCDVQTVTEVACFEGEEQFVVSATANQVNSTPSNYAQPYSFGGRMDQIVILRDSVHEAVSLVRTPFDNALFINMYLRLCEKYFYLITYVNRPLYEANILHPGLLQKSLLYMSCAAITIYPDLEYAMDHIHQALAKLYAHYNLFPDPN